MVEDLASCHSEGGRTVKNSSYGEREEVGRHSVVGIGKSPGMVVVAVHGDLERDHPFRSSHEDHPDNQGHDIHSAHSFQRCAGDQTSSWYCVG